MEIVAIMGTTACVVVALMILFFMLLVVLYNAVMWYRHSQRVGQQPRGQQARPVAPVQPQPANQVTTWDVGRNIAHTPVIVLENGPGKDLYAVLAFVPPGHPNTNAMPREFLPAVNGSANYQIVTEIVAIQTMGKRYAGVVYVQELDVPKVV